MITICHLLKARVSHRWLLTLSVLALFFSTASATSADLDSLIQAAEGMPLSKDKGNAYLDLANKHMFKDVEKAKHFAQEARKVGLAIGEDSLVAAGYFREGTVHVIKSESDSVILKYRKSLEIAKRIGDDFLETGIHLNLGVMYMKLDNKEMAEKELMEAYALVDSETPPNIMRVITNNLGTLYLRKREFERAKEMYLENQQYLDSTNIRQVALNYNNLGDAVKHIDGYDKAIEYYWKGYELVKGSTFHGQLTNAFQNLVEGYCVLKEFDKAEPLLDSMEYHASLLSDPKEISSTWQARSEYFEARGDYQTALKEYKRVAKYRDSVATASQNAELAKLQAEFEVSARDADIALLEAENTLQEEVNKRANFLSTVLAIGIGLLFAGLVALVFLLRGRSRTNRLLQENNQVIQEKNRLLEKQKVVLEDLNREKDGLIGIVAHDLKSPLNKSLALIEVIQGSGPLNHAQSQAAEMIAKTNGAGMSLIRDLLELNSLEQEKADRELKRLEASSLFEEICATFSAEAGRKGIQLTFSSPPEGVSFQSHPLSICRILENLISNALKFSKSGSSVLVSAAKSGELVQLEVRDEGPGISKEEQDKLFKKFQRLSAQPTGGESSTGLGLAITKSLVDKLGGSILVKSEVGKGTAFVIQLPTA